MKAFNIDAENNITAFASAKAAPKTEGTQLFTSEDALAELAATWPASRLVEIFNSLTGVMPVKKFTSRGTAVARIWKAIQTLGEAEAPQSADAAPEAAPAKKKASRATKAPKPATKAAKAAGSGPRESSKTAQLIEMLKRAGGATLDDICTKFGWQSHTTRALMSAGGSLAKKHGLTVVSTKGENGERTHSLAS
jgi:hypothetical protein